MVAAVIAYKAVREAEFDNELYLIDTLCDKYQLNKDDFVIESNGDLETIRYRIPFSDRAYWSKVDAFVKAGYLIYKSKDFYWLHSYKEENT